MRLVVGREPAVADPVQVAKPHAEAAVEVLGAHAVQHVHPGLPVLGGRDGDEVLAEPVLRVAHQHALVALLGLHAAELAHGHGDAFPVRGGDFHPIAAQGGAGELRAAHQVVRREFVVLLESDLIVAAVLRDGLYLAVGRADHQLATHTAHLLDQQFQGHQRLPDGHLVNGQVAQPGQRVHP